MTMEEYFLDKRFDCANLKKAVIGYGNNLKKIIIKNVGASDKNAKINENLEGRTLRLEKYPSGLYLFIDNTEPFRFLLKEYQMGFSVWYDRCMNKKANSPDEKGFPDPKLSIFHNIIDSHVIKVYFEDKVPLEFHRWDDIRKMKYWKVA